MVFDGRWKYIHASGFRPMLYDLLEDPEELTDRGEDASCAEVIARLQSRAVRVGAASEGPYHHQHPRGSPPMRSEQLQVKGGILIGIWDEAELVGDPRRKIGAAQINT